MLSTQYFNKGLHRGYSYCLLCSTAHTYSCDFLVLAELCKRKLTAYSVDCFEKLSLSPVL